MHLKATTKLITDRNGLKVLTVRQSANYTLSELLDVFDLQWAFGWHRGAWLAMALICLAEKVTKFGAWLAMLLKYLHTILAIELTVPGKYYNQNDRKKTARKEVGGGKWR